jgi:hypothetical protein
MEAEQAAEVSSGETTNLKTPDTTPVRKTLSVKMSACSPFLTQLSELSAVSLYVSFVLFAIACLSCPVLFFGIYILLVLSPWYFLMSKMEKCGF